MHNFENLAIHASGLRRKKEYINILNCAMVGDDY